MSLKDIASDIATAAIAQSAPQSIGKNTLVDPRSYANTTQRPNDVGKNTLIDPRAYGGLKSAPANQLTQPNILANSQKQRSFGDVSKAVLEAPVKALFGPVIGQTAIDPSKLFDKDAELIGEGGFFDPDLIPVFGSTERERNQRKEREQYKEQQLQNPRPSADEMTSRYNDYFASQGGLDDSYVSSWDDFRNALTTPNPNANPLIGAVNLPLLRSGVNKLANETIDNGTLTKQNVTALNMTGEQYKRYQDMGAGGRPYDEIDDNAVYSKLDEERDYGFMPYYEDGTVPNRWYPAQIGNDVTKMFNMFSNARSRKWRPKVNYSDTQLDREDLFSAANDYYDDVSELWGDGEPTYDDYGNLTMIGDLSVVPAGDHTVTPDDVPLTHFWGVGSQVFTGSEEPPIVWYEGDDGSVQFIDIEDIVDWDRDYYRLHDYGFAQAEPGEPVDYYAKIPLMEFQDVDGSPLNMGYNEVNNLLSSIANGTADMDWGPANLAKGSGDRKGFTQMLTSFDARDLAPNMVDLALGSAPLFFKQTAWPMAAGNAITATQGLDPHLYDIDNNTMARVADDDSMGADRYLSNIVLSGTVPATERLAGGIGGTESVAWKALQNYLGRKGAPGTLRYLLDALGEGVEEDIASLWEDAQTYGIRGLYADPVYSLIPEYNPVTGEYEQVPLKDKSGHEIRNLETPFRNRVKNWAEGVPENFLAGLALGSTLGAPAALTDASGYRAQSQEQRAQNLLADEAGVPRFRDDYERGTDFVRITPEDLGGYNVRRDNGSTGSR